MMIFTTHTKTSTLWPQEANELPVSTNPQSDMFARVLKVKIFFSYFHSLYIMMFGAKLELDHFHL